MIDIHSHILPGLDDGSPDLEVSVAMVQQAAETGTTDIVASPHADTQFSFDPAATESKISELVEASGGVVRIHYGCDFHLHYENVRDALENRSKYTIGHRNYLLVELPELLTTKTADEVLSRLLAAGLDPIVTHPERNSMLQRRIGQLETWVSAGYLIQVTGQSLLGDFGRGARACCQQLLERGLVHFVASDGHDCTARPPRLDLACHWVRQEYGDEVAERLFTANPSAVIRGESLPTVDPAAGNRRRKWWHF